MTLPERVIAAWRFLPADMRSALCSIHLALSRDLIVGIIPKYGPSQPRRETCRRTKPASASQIASDLSNQFSIGLFSSRRWTPRLADILAWRPVQLFVGRVV